MSRSVNLYFLDEGILSNVGGHLKRNWGKYALGAAALAAGGVAGAKGALGSTVQGGINAARGAVNSGLNAGAKVVPGGQTLKSGITKVVGTGKDLVNQGINTGKQLVRQGSEFLYDKNANVRTNIARTKLTNANAGNTLT